MKAILDSCSATASTLRSNGRPSLYTPEQANAILAFVREQGFSPTAAVEESGINRGTLSRWRIQYTSFDERVHSAITRDAALRLRRRAESRGLSFLQVAKEIFA